MSASRFLTVLNHSLRASLASRHLQGLRFLSTSTIRPVNCCQDEGEPSYKTVLYHVKDRVAYITLNRPEHLNAINYDMPGEIKAAVKRANNDDTVKVIILAGKGRAFCAGYDLKMSVERERGEDNIGNQKMPWDPYEDYRIAYFCTKSFMSLWHSYKPTIAKIHGYGIAGGSDMALCTDMVIMAEDAKIGYPPTRVWGCPTTAMWTFRLGPEKAKRMMLTGDLISGTEAAKMGLVLEAVPADKLDETVQKLADRMKTVPANQLFFQKQVVNQVAEQMGLFQAQRLSSLFDGMTRHSPEGLAFQKYSLAHGFKNAVKLRDSGEMDWTEEAKKYVKE
ncbi:putative enoyl-CoA hydratase, mitochondrial [Holothuria leucospilota]|uniref:Enoyl-CoA hydratase, mitochondrial n=1 Tax=Holothuria leucospilota TaxID=206669 RepID=A0A9Q1C4A5_HOLLE|nr:putative enoyl-CoA hydratase, mitochondrial [Holothuria leucospilota]